MTPFLFDIKTVSEGLLSSKQIPEKAVNFLGRIEICKWMNNSVTDSKSPKHDLELILLWNLIATQAWAEEGYRA